MFERQKSGSVLCPSCGSLVGVNDESCYTCGRRRPGLFGFAALLRHTGEDMGFLWLTLFACGALFMLTLASSEEPFTSGQGIWNLLAPDGEVLLRFGGTGGWPVFARGRWWTVLSYAWLHGSAIHIVFNMMALRNLVPAVAHLYGPARTIIIYTAAAVGGAVLSSGMAYAPFLPSFLAGSRFTIGASGAVFGLVGALAYYGRRGGSRMIGEQAWGWIVSGLLMGLVMPRVDNWCHFGGLAAGYLAARFLDPLHPERGDHVIVAVLCLVASAASILASLLIDIPGLR